MTFFPPYTIVDIYRLEYELIKYFHIDVSKMLWSKARFLHEELLEDLNEQAKRIESRINNDEF